jgi:hypothetical protein
LLQSGDAVGGDDGVEPQCLTQENRRPVRKNSATMNIGSAPTEILEAKLMLEARFLK